MDHVNNLQPPRTPPPAYIDITRDQGPAVQQDDRPIDHFEVVDLPPRGRVQDTSLRNTALRNLRGSTTASVISSTAAVFGGNWVGQGEMPGLIFLGLASIGETYAAMRMRQNPLTQPNVKLSQILFSIGAMPMATVAGAFWGLSIKNDQNPWWSMLGVFLSVAVVFEVTSAGIAKRDIKHALAQRNTLPAYPHVLG